MTEQQDKEDGDGSVWVLVILFGIAFALLVVIQCAHEWGWNLALLN